MGKKITQGSSVAAHAYPSVKEPPHFNLLLHTELSIVVAPAIFRPEEARARASNIQAPDPEVGHKQEEVPVVLEPNAVVHPGAVVVHLQHAP